MTQREREILQIIRDDPMISQYDIAKKLGITRSAISAYLNTMYKKGILKGRGYIINEELEPLLIGPSHVDIRSVCGDRNAGQSTPIYTAAQPQITYGGPIKNIAEYLMEVGISSRAMFAVASDSFGASFLSACRQKGIDSSGSVVVPNSTSPVYMEMVDQDQQLIASSFATSDLTTAITPAHLAGQSPLLRGTNLIALHDSVPPESVTAIHTISPSANLFLVSSSAEYSLRHVPLFPLFCCAMLHYDIAFEIVSQVGDLGRMLDYTPDQPLPIVRALAKLGLSNFYLLLDHSSVCHCDGKTLTVHIAQLPAGAGGSLAYLYSDCRDIFSALALYGLENQTPGEELLDLLAAAQYLVGSSSAYFDRSVTIDSLEKRASELFCRLKTFQL